MKQVPYSLMKVMKDKARSVALKHFMFLALITISTAYNYSCIKKISIEYTYKIGLVVLVSLPFFIILKNSGSTFIKALEIYLSLKNIMKLKE